MRTRSGICKGLIGLFVSAVLIILDQFTKNLAVTHLKGQESIVLWEGVFELHYLENRGAAFGILQEKQALFLILTTVVVLLIIYFYLFRLPNERRFLWLNISAVLFFAGAIGNYIDRLMQGYVVDFFYFRLIDFPIFNMADIYVTVAAVLLLVFGFFYYNESDFERIFPSKKKEEV